MASVIDSELKRGEEAVAKSCYTLAGKSKVAVDSNINAHLIAASNLSNNSPLIITALTDNTIQIYNNENLTKIQTLKGHSKAITHIRLSKLQKDIFYSSSLDGTIILWDLRINGAAREFRDDSHAKIKPFCSLDISCNESYMCAGTEQLLTEAFIIFWDLRNVKPLGGYWDSHTDDITTLSFHDTKPNIVTSGSTDGLINIFDISQTNEDDALQNTLNTESSVDTLRWCCNGEKIACLTHNETIQIWDSNKMEIDKTYDRDDFTKKLKVRSILSQLLGLSVNENSHFPTLALTTQKEETLLVEINSHEPVAHGILPNSCKAPLTGLFWNMTESYALTANEDAEICYWRQMS